MAAQRAEQAQQRQQRQQGRTSRGSQIIASQNEDGQQRAAQPDLPVLRAAPSARRAYSYGAAVEPPPRVPAYGAEGGQIDLAAAVRNARQRRREQLEREEEEINRVFPMEGRAPAVQEAARRKAETETAERSTTTTTSRIGNVPRLRSSGQESSTHDDDDARSFDMESDVFDDATIASMTGARPESARPTPNNNRPNGAGPARNIRRSGDSAYEDPTHDRSANDDDSESSGEEEEELTTTISNPNPRPRRRYDPGINTFSELRGQIAAARGPLSLRSGNGRLPRSKSSWFSLTPDTSERATKTDLGNAAQRHGSVQQRQSDYSTQDDELQEDIERSESENERRSQESSSEATSDEDADDDQVPSSTFFSFFSFAWLQSLTNSHSNVAEEGEQAETNEDDFRWWQLLNPYTYFKALVWALSTFFETLQDIAIMLFPPKLQEQLKRLLANALYGAALLVTALTISGIIQALFQGPHEEHNWLSIPERGLKDASQLAHRVGSLVPTILWPGWKTYDGLPDRWNLDGADTSDILDYMHRYEQDTETLKQAAKVHDASLKKLEAILPKMIHVDVKNGKPVISEEFWHALRELLRADDTFFTLNKKGNNFEIRSEQQIKAIAAKVAKDKAIIDVMDESVKTVENRINSNLPVQLESWMKANGDKIAKLLGSALDQIQAAGSQKEFDKRLKQIVKESIAQDAQNVVSKDEFLRHLGQELASQRTQLRAELTEMLPKIDEVVKRAAKLVQQELPEIVKRGDITTMVHGMIQKAMAGINLDSIAKNKIHNHWDKVLKHQVNYFSPGAGASIDGQHTSPVYVADKPPTKEQVNKGYAVYRHPNPTIALQAWQEEGERWCATRSTNRRGNPHGAVLAVQMGHRITPQHVVVEHIVAEATVDAAARPREIEVYADIDADIRDRVRDFSAARFPDNTADWNFAPAEFPDRFVKIGQFVYEEHQPEGGVQVHRLSDELAELGVETDHVIIRAISNYGAKDHTCFYRVRLFGQASSGI